MRRGGPHRRWQPLAAPQVCCWPTFDGKAARQRLQPLMGLVRAAAGAPAPEQRAPR